MFELNIKARCGRKNVRNIYAHAYYISNNKCNASKYNIM